MPTTVWLSGVDTPSASSFIRSHFLLSADTRLFPPSPSFMLVDFYTSSQGAVFDVAAELNGVSAPTNTIAPYLAGSSTKSSAAASSSGGVTSEPLSAGHRGVGGFTGGMTGLMGLVGVVTGLGLVGGAKILF